jgi:hypothetical protein
MLRITRIKRMTRISRVMTATRDVEMKTMANLVKNIDVLREKDGNHPGNTPNIEAIAGPEIVITQIVNKTIIVFVVATTIINVKMKRHPVQKY